MVEKILVERLIVDKGSDLIYSLGVKPEHEFEFEFVIRDEVANISISSDYQNTICIVNPYSASYYGMLGSSVIIESILHDKFIDTLELFLEGKEREALLFRSPENEYPELGLSLFEGELLIDYMPTRRRKKKEQNKDKVKIAFDHIGRVLTVVRKVKDFPYKEKVRFTEISFE